MQLRRKRPGIELISVTYAAPSVSDKQRSNVMFILKEQPLRCRLWDPLVFGRLFSCRTQYNKWFHISSDWIFGSKGKIVINPTEKRKE